MYLRQRREEPRSGYHPSARLLPRSRVGSIVHDRRLGIGIAKAGGAGAVGVGRDRRRGAAVHRTAIGIDRPAEASAARVRPHQVGATGTVHDVDVIAQELLLQVVVAGAVWVRRGAADPQRRAEGSSTRRGLGVVVVVDLHARLPGVAGRGLGERVKG